MSEKEKQHIVDAWNKHVESNNRHHNLASFSSIREENFRKMFRDGILNHKRLTQAEKLALFECTGL